MTSGATSASRQNSVRSAFAVEGAALSHFQSSWWWLWRFTCTPQGETRRNASEQWTMSGYVPSAVGSRCCLQPTARRVQFHIHFCPTCHHSCIPCADARPTECPPPALPLQGPSTHFAGHSKSDKIYPLKVGRISRRATGGHWSPMEATQQHRRPSKGRVECLLRPEDVPRLRQ